MSERADFLDAGRQLLELQLAMMNGALNIMTSGTRQLMQLGLAATTPAARAAAGSPAASAARTKAAARPAPAPGDPRPASAREDYVLRVQEDMESILHAFAMAPDTADRMIRAAVQQAERPAGGRREPRAAAPAKPSLRRRRAAPGAAEHAR